MKLEGDTAIKNVNLLVVDDEEPCLLSVMMMFYGTDVNVIAERDSRKALEYIKDNYKDLDIILLDLMMPDVDGVEFLEGLQELGLEKHIPVILQTGSTNFKFVEKALDMGAIGYIPKPFIKEEAIEVINKVLNR